jgi:hypothetical protein
VKVRWPFLSNDATGRYQDVIVIPKLCSAQRLAVRSPNGEQSRLNGPFGLHDYGRPFLVGAAGGSAAVRAPQWRVSFALAAASGAGGDSGHGATLTVNEGVMGFPCASSCCCSVKMRSPYFLGASLPAIHLRVSTRKRERLIFSWLTRSTKPPLPSATSSTSPLASSAIARHCSNSRSACSSLARAYRCAKSS